MVSVVPASQVKFAVTNPLEAHAELLRKYTDEDIAQRFGVSANAAASEIFLLWINLKRRCGTLL